MAATLLAGLGARVSAGVLARARLAPAGTAAGGAAAAAVAGALLRGLASGPADVADRVCAVVKNFEKVPADKVRIPPIELDPGSPPPAARAGEAARGGRGAGARGGWCLGRGSGPFPLPSLIPSPAPVPPASPAPCSRPCTLGL